MKPPDMRLAGVSQVAAVAGGLRRQQRQARSVIDQTLLPIITAARRSSGSGPARSHRLIGDEMFIRAGFLLFLVLNVLMTVVNAATEEWGLFLFSGTVAALMIGVLTASWDTFWRADK